MRREFSNNVVKEICDKYLNFIKIKDLRKKYNLCPNTLYSILRRGNVVLHGSPKIESKKIDRLIKIINSGKSLEKAISIVGISPSCAQKYLKLRNYKLPYVAGTFNKKYKIDDTFFEIINTKAKAQVLGVLYADGSVSKRNHLISIRLQASDKEYLESIKRVIKSTKPLFLLKGRRFKSITTHKFYMGSDMYALDITNHKMYKDAINLGLIPNKKQKNVPLPVIFKNLTKYFILGYFEGDGWISIFKDKRHTHRNCYMFAMGVCGSKKLCKGIQACIKKELNIDGHFRPFSSIYTLTYQRINDIIKLVRWLYTGCAFKMQRKYDKCQELFKILRGKGYKHAILK